MPQSTPWSSCTAQRADGSFCDKPTIPDAPFPVCFKHGGQLYAFLRERVEQASGDQQRSLDVLVDILGRREEILPTREATAHGVVYYVQVGAYIKIGCSVNLRARLRSYPLDRRLLATEPGYDIEEAERHSQFAEYRAMGREWFHPGERLVEHINRLRRAQRAKPIRVVSAPAID